MEKTAFSILKNKQFFQNLMSEDYSQRENTFFGEKKNYIYIHISTESSLENNSTLILSW